MFEIMMVRRGAPRPHWRVPARRHDCGCRRSDQDRLFHALTGGLASNGKAILAAYQMWEEDINAKGGILGRPVKLIYYDDHSNPSLVPAIYAKLFDVDKIDLAFTSYGTNLSVPSMPVVIRATTCAGAVRARREQRVQLPLLLLHVPGRARCRARVLARVFRDRQGAEAADRRDRGRRFRLRQEGGGRRAENATKWASRSSTTAAIRPTPSISLRSCAASRRAIRISSTSRRIRPKLSASCAGKRGRSQDQAVRRRHGRPAICRHQDPARRAAQQDRRLRLLRPRTHRAVQGDRELLRATRPRRRRSAPICSAISSRPSPTPTGRSSSRRCGRGQPRSEEARRPHQGAQLRYHRRQDRIRAERRMEEPARALGAIPRIKGNGLDSSRRPARR